jgi:hypothetical protein
VLGFVLVLSFPFWFKNIWNLTYVRSVVSGLTSWILLFGFVYRWVRVWTGFFLVTTERPIRLTVETGTPGAHHRQAICHYSGRVLVPAVPPAEEAVDHLVNFGFKTIYHHFW